MRRVAGELGIAVMSRYNYVPAKEHLAQLMTDHLAAEYAYPGPPAPDACGCRRYTFFEQCPHRMACAKCDFYAPKDSSKSLLLEARDNLQRKLPAVPLTEDEQAAVDD